MSCTAAAQHHACDGSGVLITPRRITLWAVSSAGEHRPYKPGVGRSIRPPPTRFACSFMHGAGESLRKEEPRASSAKSLLPVPSDSFHEDDDLRGHDQEEIGPQPDLRAREMEIRLPGSPQGEIDSGHEHRW